MYLSPLSVKTKHARVGSFTTCLGCPRFSLTNSCSRTHTAYTVLQHVQVVLNGV